MKMVCAAIIFDFVHLTLKNSIAKDNKFVSIVINSEQNKILEPYSVNAIYRFIQFLLVHNIQLSKKMVFNIIIILKHAQNFSRKISSIQWFRK